MRRIHSYLYFARHAVVFVLAMVAPLCWGATPEGDPNFPVNQRGEFEVPGAGTLSWSNLQAGPVSPAMPVVYWSIRAVNQRAPAFDYLGYLEGQGSLLENPIDQGVYLFNRSPLVYQKKFASVEDIPLDVLASLKNRKYVYISKREPLSVLPFERPMAKVPGRKPERDPNSPEGADWTTFQQVWQLSPLRLGVGPVYLGFDDQHGSFYASGSTGKIVTWDLPSKSLKAFSDTWWEMPLDLRNPSVIVQSLIYYRENAYRDSATRGKALDPNFPPGLGVQGGTDALVVHWLYLGGTDTTPRITGPQGIRYLGFDERGTWLEDSQIGIVVWSFKTLALTRIATNLRRVPPAALARLRNPEGQTITAEY